MREDVALTPVKKDGLKRKERPTDQGFSWLVKTQYISPLSTEATKQVKYGWEVLEAAFCSPRQIMLKAKQIIQNAICRLLLTNKRKNCEKSEEAVSWRISITGLLFIYHCLCCESVKTEYGHAKHLTVMNGIQFCSGKGKSRKLRLHLRHVNRCLFMQPTKNCSLSRFCLYYLISNGTDLLYCSSVYASFLSIPLI